MQRRHLRGLRNVETFKQRCMPRNHLDVLCYVDIPLDLGNRVNYRGILYVLDLPIKENLNEVFHTHTIPKMTFRR